MNDRDWKVLLSGLASHNCVALVGPGLSATGPDGEEHNVADVLSRHLAQILEEEKDVRVVERENLPLVAEFFSDGFSRDELEVEVAEFYTKCIDELGQNGASDPTFAGLARLPLPLIVSVRHDRRLQHYLRAHGKEPTEKAYDFRGDKLRTIGELGTVDRPLIYYLMGSIDEPRSLAITEGDQLDLVKAIIAGAPDLPADLRNQFQEKSFLFLGWGIHLDRIRQLVHALGLDQSRKKSFALDPVPPGGDKQQFVEDYGKRVLYYQVGYKQLKLLDVDEGEFVQELCRRWEEMAPTGNGQASPVPRVSLAETENRPTVFVSYVKEDAPFAQDLVESLRNYGLDPWFDKEQLRGGVQWSHALDDAIGSQADFFIVLLSEHFTDGVETYVHLEVKKALDRSVMRGALQFIYPLMISENVELLDALNRAQIQAERFSGDDPAVRSLATDIKKQFAKLRRRG